MPLQEPLSQSGSCSHSFSLSIQANHILSLGSRGAHCFLLSIESTTCELCSRFAPYHPGLKFEFKDTINCRSLHPSRSLVLAIHFSRPFYCSCSFTFSRPSTCSLPFSCSRSFSCSPPFSCSRPLLVYALFLTLLHLFSLCSSRSVPPALFLSRCSSRSVPPTRLPSLCSSHSVHLALFLPLVLALFLPLFRGSTRDKAPTWALLCFR